MNEVGSTARDAIRELLDRINRDIIGQERVVERMVVALLANGNVLLEGLPGLAKTRAIKSLSKNLESDFSRIQFTPDLLPSDVTGGEILRHLIRTYIGDADLPDTERVLFAFAAYNAGPGNLRKFRSKAKQMGLDPDRWFDNVEHGAAATVGRETVDYVANIYKYYVAYRMLRDGRASRCDTAAAPSRLPTAETAATAAGTAVGGCDAKP